MPKRAKQTKGKEKDPKKKSIAQGWNLKQREGHMKICKRQQTEEQKLIQKVKEMAKAAKEAKQNQ